MLIGNPSLCLFSKMMQKLSGQFLPVSVLLLILKQLLLLTFFGVKKQKSSISAPFCFFLMFFNRLTWTTSEGACLFVEDVAFKKEPQFP